MLTLIKFLLTMTLELSSTNASDDPLPQISTQMQQQVANAVRNFIRSPPDIFITDFCKAALESSADSLLSGAGEIRIRMSELCQS